MCFSQPFSVTTQAQCRGFILFHAFPPSILPSLAIARRRNWHCCILLFNSFRWSLVFYLQNQTFPLVLSARVRIEKATLVREKCLGGDCFFGKTNVYPRAKRKSFTKGHVKYPPPLLPALLLHYLARGYYFVFYKWYPVLVDIIANVYK